MFDWLLCGAWPSGYLEGVAASLLSRLAAAADEPAPLGDESAADEGGAEPSAEPAPAFASRFDLEELLALQRAHARGDAEGGLAREHLHEAFASLLPVYAIDRLFSALARPVPTAAAGADGAPARLRVGWAEWVDGLAAAAKPATAAQTLASANASRLLALFDLFASGTASPSAHVIALDRDAAVTDAFHADAAFAGAFPSAGADARVRAAAAAALPASPSAGALDAPCLLALLTCCFRQCVDPTRLRGASAGLEPLIADALLNGNLSRAAWLRWSAASIPRLGAAFELLAMRGVGALAGDAEPAAAVARLAEVCGLPCLVGGEPAEAEEEAGSSSPLLPPALQWAIALSLPPRADDRGGADGGGTDGGAALEGGWPDTWRRLYSSAEHGLAMNRLAKHALGYAGQTLLIVKEARLLGSRAPSSSSEPASAGGAEGGGAPEPAPPEPMRWAALVDEGWRALAPGQALGGDGCVAYSLAPRFHPHRVRAEGARQCASLVLPVHALLAPSHHHRDFALATTGPAARQHMAGGAHGVPGHAEEEPGIAIGGGGLASPPPSAPTSPTGSRGGAQPIGGFGGMAAGGGRGAGCRRAPRAALTADLTQSHWQHADETYEDDARRLQLAGQPLARPPMRVAVVEVWGLGGAAADSAQHRAQVEAERTRARAARVDRAAFGESWSDSADRVLLEYGGRSFFSGEAHSLGLGVR